MTTTLEELKSDVDHLRARADVADSRAMETRQLLTDLKTDVGTVKSNVGYLYELATAMTDDIARTDRNVTGIKGDVTVLKGDVSGIKGDVTVLKGDVGVLKGDVIGIKGDVGVLKGDVTGLRRDFARQDQNIMAIMRHFGLQTPEETGES